jgi:release factor glutamine methyltransferase
MTYRDALSIGTARLVSIGSGRRDAELLLLRTTGRERAFLLTHPDAELTAEQQASYQRWLDRRAKHEPVQYILGEQEFYGLTLRVTPDVLIPRPETEHLVEATLSRVAHDATVRIADIGTGSGAIAIALARSLPLAKLTALELSPPALEVARQNADRHGVADRIRFLHSDLLTAVQGETFDAIVSNPPYIAADEVLEEQVGGYEPPNALFAGPAGLDIYRRLIPNAWQALSARGWLLMEIGHGQREAVAGLLTGWSEIEFVADLQGIPRVACGRRA